MENTRRHIEQFKNEERGKRKGERGKGDLLNLLALKKYFEKTGRYI
jgi:hypothetical protein